MSEFDPVTFSNRNDEAQEYLEKHKINELFANITAQLVFNQTGKYRLKKLNIRCYSMKFCFII